MRLRDTSEVEFLRGVRQLLGEAGGRVRLGIGDDAAVIDCPPGRSLVLTCDASVEGRHFRREWLSPHEIGERAVRCALSDLAAMGAEPAAILLTLIISPDEDAALAQGLIEGGAQAAETFGARLAGGETVGREGPLELDVVATGFVEPGRELTRSGACPGDVVMVSGTLGDSAAGLAALTGTWDAVAGSAGTLAGSGGSRRRSWDRAHPCAHAVEAVIARYKRPEPRLALGQLLGRSDAVHAAIDISDGLARDAGHLAEQSGVAIVLHTETIPLSTECRTLAEHLGLDPLPWALTGGEDFELLFCVRSDAAPAIARLAHDSLGLPLTTIGEVTEGHGVCVMHPDGTDLPLRQGGWDQFRST
jgi:thiamine-monophosphate kinase